MAAWQAKAIPHDPFGWLGAGAPADLAAVLAVAGRPAAHPSAPAAVAAGWFIAQATGGPNFALPLPRRLFLRFYAFLLEGLESAPIKTLLRSHHIDCILELCREMVKAVPE